jgi:hypothetical protein
MDCLGAEKERENYQRTIISDTVFDLLRCSEFFSIFQKKKENKELQLSVEEIKKLVEAKLAANRKCLKKKSSSRKLNQPH